jgi:hypothetical protein
VGNVAKTQMSRMHGFEGTNTMEKIQAEWVVRDSRGSVFEGKNMP